VCIYPHSPWCPRRWCGSGPGPCARTAARPACGWEVEEACSVSEREVGASSGNNGVYRARAAPSQGGEGVDGWVNGWVLQPTAPDRAHGAMDEGPAISSACESVPHACRLHALLWHLNNVCDVQTTAGGWAGTRGGVQDRWCTRTGSGERLLERSWTGKYVGQGR
jgi:hypothetical protein